MPEHGGVKALAFADGGKKLVVADGQGSITIWDCSTQQPTETLRGAENPLQSVAATADGRRLISGSLEGIVSLWDLDVGRTPTTLEKNGMWIKAVAFSPDGSKLAFASNMDFSVRIWELLPSESH